MDTPHNESKNPRRLVGYVSPYYARLAKSYAKYTDQSESRIVADAVREKFNSMPVSEREMILKYGK
jgi:hypothetical protein